MVARNMTMNCARWQDIAFSAEYYHSGQKLLVAKDPSGKSPCGSRTSRARRCARHEARRPSRS